MDKYTHIWVRMGMTLSVTRDEMDLLISDGKPTPFARTPDGEWRFSEGKTPEEQQKCLAKIFEEGRAVISGDSYIPYCVVEEYNQLHKSNYESREYDLDTNLLTGKKVRLSE